MDINLPKWIMASVAAWAESLHLTAGPAKIFIEGIDEPEIEDFQNESVNVRVDGPIVHEGSNGEEWYTVELQFLFTEYMGLNVNGYNLHQVAGAWQATLINSPPSIFKYGPLPGDDSTLVCCLTPDTSVRNNVRIANYGVIDKTARVRQMSVNGKFVLYC